MGDEYWGGGTFVYQVQITNGAGGGGNISIEMTPGRGDELEILSIHVLNGDTAGRLGRALIRNPDDDTVDQPVVLASVGVGAAVVWPNASTQATDAPSGPGRRILSGTMNLFAEVQAVAASQDASFAIAARLRAGVPTIAETGNSTPTITINTEQVF